MAEIEHPGRTIGHSRVLNTSVTATYKASAALNFKDKTALKNGKGTLGDKHREELIRDVAAMANAEGGLIIYGIAKRCISSMLSSTWSG
jgi:Putative DNA-binding domain